MNNCVRVNFCSYVEIFKSKGYDVVLCTTFFKVH
jgi:hypothetical protein